MNNVPSDNDDGREALSHPLQAAVDAMRRRPVPSALIDRSLARANALGERLDAIDAEGQAAPVARNRPIRRGGLWRRVAILATVVAVALFVPSLLRTWGPSPSWGQVVAAVKERPWIHLVWLGPDASRGDSWIDLARNRTAWRREKWLYFDDLKSRVHETFDPTSETILRTPLESESLKIEVFGVSRMLRELLGAVPEVGSFVYGVEKVVARHEAEIVDDGRKLVEFTLDLQRGKIVLHIDPRSHLPVGISVRDGAQADAPVTRFALEYPVDGPAEIYAFGAPRTAKIIDCCPPTGVSEIRNRLDAAQSSFGDYVAHVVKLYGQRPDEVLRVWRSGKRFRLERVRSARLEREIPGVELPAKNADESAWIAELDRKLSYSPFQLFDGTVMYQRRADNNDPQRGWVPLMHPGPEQDIDRWLFRPFQSGMPHNYLFPATGYLYEVRPAELENKPDDGPAGSIRTIAHLTERFPSDGATNEILSEHWFDPNREFACMKYCRTQATGKDDKSLVECFEMDGFRKSPRGVWYPTIVRMCDNEGKPLTGERAVELRLYFDFNRVIPPDAFELPIEPLRNGSASSR